VVVEKGGKWSEILVVRGHAVNSAGSEMGCRVEMPWSFLTDKHGAPESVPDSVVAHLQRLFDREYPV
jgi:hypothetical protein